MTTASNLVAASTRLIGTAANNLLALDGSAKIPAVDASQVTGLLGSQIAALSGSASSALRQATSVASTSGTAIDFTGIPSWAKRITVMFAGVSTSATSNVQVQLGTGAGPTFTTTGYLSSAQFGANAVNSTTGFLAGFSLAANALLHGAIVLTQQNPATNTWVEHGSVSRSDQANAIVSSGSIALAAALTAVRITTVNGTDTFDAGSLNITWE